MAGATRAFAVNRGDLYDARLDAPFNAPSNSSLLERVRSSPYDVVSLGSVLVEDLAGGATPKRGDDALYADNAEGVAFLRIQNVTEHGLDLTDVRYIARSVHNGELQRSVLKAGDVLFTITGRIGSASVVRPEHLPANINQHIVRMRFGSDVLPEFAVEVFNSDVGLALSNAGVTGGTRSALDYGAIRSLSFVKPPLDVQRRLVADLAAARDARTRAHAEADRLIASVDAQTMEALGVPPLSFSSKPVFALSRKTLLRDGKLSPGFNHPERLASIAAQAQANATPFRLGDLVAFEREQVDATDALQGTYLGLASVQSHTGERLPVAETASGTAFAYKPGDILFARLRPYLNKVYLAEGVGICSTEFHVLRLPKGSSVLPAYLALVLRSSLILAQTRHMTTGNTHPRLANEDVDDLVVPIAAREVQERLVEMEVNARAEARRLWAEADAAWADARAAFETALLGGAA